VAAAPLVNVTGPSRTLYGPIGMGARQAIDDSLSRALAHPLRWRILEVISERGESSPIELARALDQPLATISHHVRVLRDSRCVELARTEPRRGAIEHYYRAVLPTFFDDEQWSRVPIVFRRTVAGQVFRRIFEEGADAGAAGAFDAPGAHADRMVVELDDCGWHELSDLLDKVLREVQRIQDRSDARGAGEGGTRASEVAILHFERAESIAGDGPSDGAARRPRRTPPVR
jgi:DNA-binding transcriptional ArsR family regulator